MAAYALHSNRQLSIVINGANKLKLGQHKVYAEAALNLKFPGSSDSHLYNLLHMWPTGPELVYYAVNVTKAACSTLFIPSVIKHF